MPAIEGEAIRLSWEEIQAEREFEDFFADFQISEERYVRAVGMLTFCVNDLTGITDVERSLLRELLHATAMRQSPQWGSMNHHRMEEVRVLFEKIKSLINA